MVRVNLSVSEDFLDLVNQAQTRGRYISLFLISITIAAIHCKKVNSIIIIYDKYCNMYIYNL